MGEIVEKKKKQQQLSNLKSGMGEGLLAWPWVYVFLPHQL